ncbi:uncharacterized protein LOC106651439 [Trichogramma pretiosum]|uniref:uncharacterized protein LOC106651439 n=1 Tax=Trichogramma pretiosum TaxID=7493 RepID=UPI0006C941AB|nr:uncharacterized protein LOC106651439 [Trichogramma pretiosum]
MSKKSLNKCNNANGPIPSKETFVRMNTEAEPAGFSTICGSKSGLDSLAPDKLVNVIVKDKTHPMAKLLIGNMIGLNNEESKIVAAYQTLTTIKNQDDFSKSKEYKLKNKFYIKNKHKNILNKQRREIANLAIDAKFETITRATRSGRLRSPRKRLSKAEVVPQRKMINVPRIQSKNFTIHKSEKEIRKTVGKKKTKLKETSTQCELLKPTYINKGTQTERVCGIETIDENGMKIDLIEMDDVKEEPQNIESNNDTESLCNNSLPPRTYSSAFAVVRTSNVNCRIALLRSIGFKPINPKSPIIDDEHGRESICPQADEEYNKYNSEETEDVGYMNVSLHYEDLEEEITQEMLHTVPPPLTSLTEADFSRAWHGWQKVRINGKDYWSGY